jgi:hypothetical protein
MLKYKFFPRIGKTFYELSFANREHMLKVVNESQGIIYDGNGDSVEKDRLDLNTKCLEESGTCGWSCVSTQIDQEDNQGLRG